MPVCAKKIEILNSKAILLQHFFNPQFNRIEDGMSTFNKMITLEDSVKYEIGKPGSILKIKYNDDV